MKAEVPRNPAPDDHGTPATAVTASPAAAHGLQAPNAGLLPQARADWLHARWHAVAVLQADSLAEHPDRADLSALVASASLQLGDLVAARLNARQALAWGYDRRRFVELLLAGARHTLGRAAYAGGHASLSDALFARSSSSARSSSEVRRLAQLRRDEVSADLRNAIGSSHAPGQNHALPATLGTPEWITAIVDRCLKSPDMHECVDEALQSSNASADDRMHLLMALAAHFTADKDRHTAVHFLNQARVLLPETDPSKRFQLARLLVAAGSHDSALDVIIDVALPSALSAANDPGLVRTLEQAYRQMRETTLARSEHGHHVLMSYLEKHLGKLSIGTEGRPATLIEIGTTREDIPGQGSTRKLAEFCARKGLRFVTVDMDPHNTRVARQTFSRLGVDFEAVTMKGEDYLRNAELPIDLVFLDAYDFDHGKHSELRQSRYLKFLGSRIDEEACHQMHLDCAQTLAAKLSADGLICIDDTWLDGGRWTAKGTLAMPFLLANGFAVVEARNRAALLRRVKPAEGSAPR